ncbi:MAG: 4-vinyl reductase [Deltaproteobacteria bacterium]|nr:4-vinyl reductase [Deltaproteobacteria bacterium]
MAIDVSKIIHAVMEGSKIRESKGIIPLFGVYLSLFSVNYYNRLSFEFEIRMGKTRKAQSQALLIEAAQECGYATFQGIRGSWEWQQVVAPMVESKEDQISGFVAVAVAFGWGDLVVAELVPKETLVIRANDSYEARGYIEQYGIANSAKCYMLRGVAGAFMDLVYGGDYPEGCFTFAAQEPRCRVKGDPYCEFIARRSSD